MFLKISNEPCPRFLKNRVDHGGRTEGVETETVDYYYYYRSSIAKITNQH
jgi:hypothetical protein